MQVTVQPSIISGTIQAPASKSSMQRACAAALLSKGVTTIYNPGHSNDDKAALDIIHRLGATVKQEGNHLIVTSNGIAPVEGSVHCGESGLSIRMFTPLVALSNKKISITGEGSLATRPMSFFDGILPQLSVSINSQSGRLPLVVQGPLQPRSIEVEGSLSSQFLTGLLMAYAAADASDVTLTVDDLKSKPYIDLTLDVMRQFGMKMPENRKYREFVFHRDSYEANNFQSQRSYTVEGDWSGGAFLLVAATIGGSGIVRGLDISSSQADKAMLDALINAGAGIATNGKEIAMQPSPLHAFELDATDCPDLFPPLVALAAYCKGVSVIKGVSRLAHKESDRAATLQEEFIKMNVTIELHGDAMHVHGGGKINGATVHSHHDHRIAMACAVAALKAEGATVIEEAQAVRKSYPDFYNDLISLGAAVSLPGKLFNPSTSIL